MPADGLIARKAFMSANSSDGDSLPTSPTQGPIPRGRLVAGPLPSKAPIRPSTPPPPPPKRVEQVSPLSLAASEFNEAASALSDAIRDFEATLNAHSAQVRTHVDSQPKYISEFHYIIIRLQWERMKSGEWCIHRIELHGEVADDDLNHAESKRLLDCTIEQRIDAAPLVKELVENLVSEMKDRTKKMRDAVQSLRGIVEEMGGW